MILYVILAVAGKPNTFIVNLALTEDMLKRIFLPSKVRLLFLPSKNESERFDFDT